MTNVNINDVKKPVTYRITSNGTLFRVEVFTGGFFRSWSYVRHGKKPLIGGSIRNFLSIKEAQEWIEQDKAKKGLKGYGKWEQVHAE